MTTTTATSTPDVGAEVREVLRHLATTTHRARTAVHEIAPDLPAAVDQAAAVLRVAPPGAEAKQVWRDVRRAELGLDDLETALQEAAQLRADAEPRAHPPVEPATPTAETLAEYDRQRAAAGQASTTLAALAEPVAEAQRLRAVLVETAARSAQAAVWACRRFQMEHAIAVMDQTRTTLSALRERVLAADAEHTALLQQWSRRVGHALPAPTVTWPSTPLAAPSLREPREPMAP